MTVGRPRWTSPSVRSTAWWSLDARTTSAPPDLKRGWGYCVRPPDPCNTLGHGDPFEAHERSETRHYVDITLYGSAGCFNGRTPLASQDPWRNESQVYDALLL